VTTCQHGGPGSHPSQSMCDLWWTNWRWVRGEAGDTMHITSFLISSSASQDFPVLFMEPKGSLPCSQEPAIVPIQHQMDLVHTSSLYAISLHTV
jgi:hypothetical protein